MSTRAALLVIDMLADFFERLPALAAQRETLVRNINDLTNRFRRSGQPVIWVRQEFRADLSDAFRDMRRDRIHVTIEGTAGCQVLPELVREAGDGEIVKKRYSAFFGTPLQETLQRMNPATIVVGGINTHACIRTTVIDAFQRDYDVIVATDCVGSYDQEHHDVTLKYLDGRIARLLSNQEVESIIAKRE